MVINKYLKMLLISFLILLGVVIAVVILAMLAFNFYIYSISDLDKGERISDEYVKKYITDEFEGGELEESVFAFIFISSSKEKTYTTKDGLPFVVKSRNNRKESVRTDYPQRFLENYLPNAYKEQGFDLEYVDFEFEIDEYDPKDFKKVKMEAYLKENTKDFIHKYVNELNVIIALNRTSSTEITVEEMEELINIKKYFNDEVKDAGLNVKVKTVKQVYILTDENELIKEEIEEIK